MSIAWPIRAVLIATIAPFAMAGCGGSDESGPAPAAAATSTPTPAKPSGAAGVKVGRSRLGPILVDAGGRTLYFFTADEPRKATCTSDYLNCTSLWPPLTTSGRARGGEGVKSRLLGTIHRTKPAGTQITYNGHPLYLFADDEQPGDVNGEGYFDLWYVLSPTGRPIKKQ